MAENKENKIIKMPKKEAVQEVTLEFGDKGTFVVTTASIRVAREARAAYSRGWMEGIKNGLMSEDKLRDFVNKNDVFTEDVFGVIDSLEEKLQDLQPQLEDTEDKQSIENQIIEVQKEITKNREKLSSLPDTAEDYGRTFEEAVIMSGSIYIKTSESKKIPYWKTPEDYVESRDTSGLSVVLGLHQRLLDIGVEPTEENIKEMFPDLHNLITSLNQKEEETTDE